MWAGRWGQVSSCKLHPGPASSSAGVNCGPVYLSQGMIHIYDLLWQCDYSFSALLQHRKRLDCRSNVKTWRQAKQRDRHLPSPVLWEGPGSGLGPPLFLNILWENSADLWTCCVDMDLHAWCVCFWVNGHQTEFGNIPNSPFYFWLCHMACRILAPWPEIEPVPPAMEAQCLNHWTTWEVPPHSPLKKRCEDLSLKSASHTGYSNKT